MSVKKKTGTVIRTSMEKTVVVEVERRKPNRLYKKVQIVTKRFLVHDEENVCRIGDRVIIEETRPLSARKRWKLNEILIRIDN